MAKRKKFWLGIISLSLLLISSVQLYAAEVIYAPGRFPKLFSSEVIGAGNSTTSDAIYIGDSQGYFSVQYAITGDGDLRLEYLLSLNNTDYLEPSTAVNIEDNVTSASGPGSDGKDIISFSPELAQYIKIKATEISSSDNATLNLWLGRQ